VKRPQEERVQNEGKKMQDSEIQGSTHYESRLMVEKKAEEMEMQKERNRQKERVKQKGDK
jgi:hypothetical protein